MIESQMYATDCTNLAEESVESHHLSGCCPKTRTTYSVERLRAAANGNRRLTVWEMRKSGGSFAEFSESISPFLTCQLHSVPILKRLLRI